MPSSRGSTETVRPLRNRHARSRSRAWFSLNTSRQLRVTRAQSPPTREGLNPTVGLSAAVPPAGDRRIRMSPDFIKRKILLLGDASVGKTSLIRRFVVDKFSDDYITTIGTKVTKRDLRLELGNRTVDLSLMIWDVLGQKGYKGIQESAFRGARGVILVFDVTRPETFESFDEYWVPRVRAVAGEIPMIIVGNKVDLVEGPKVAANDVAAVGKGHGMPTFVSSAKTGENVEGAFLAIGTLVAQHPEEPAEAVAGTMDE